MINNLQSLFMITRDYNTHTHTHNGILLSHKKEWNFAIFSNMDGLGGHYAKWNESEKDKFVNETKKKQTHRHREQTSSYQWGEGRVEGQDKGGEKRVIMGLYEIMFVKFLKIVKNYRI